MEYVPEESLEKVVKDGSTLPEKDVAEIAGQVLQGLKTMHAMNYVHRDLKPEVNLSTTGLDVLCYYYAD